jgi:hypothetical protein
MRHFITGTVLCFLAITGQANGNAVWWEGEAATKNDFTTTEWLSKISIPTKLSNEKWLTCHIKEGVSTDKKEFNVTYEINLPADSKYTFWVREFDRRFASPWKFRFDNGDWKKSERKHPTQNITDLEKERYLVWCNYGEFQLTKGSHTLEIKVLPRAKNKGYCTAFDCFLLTDTPFKPNGWRKPQILSKYGYIGTHVWLEGEKAKNNFTNKTRDIPETSRTLSNEKWLVCSVGADSDLDNEFRAKWKFKLPLSAPYHIWMRELLKNQASPFEYRLNGAKKWKKAPTTMPIMDEMSINDKSSVCWVNYKLAYLNEGENTLEIRISGKNRQGNIKAAIDCICISLEPFHPQGKLKPDAKIKTPNGYFAFTPNAPSPTQQAKSPLDLRRLNEKQSGSNGFCSVDAKGMIFKNGKRIRFWGVDAYLPMTASKTNVDQYVKKIASLGVNIIRVNGSLCSPETKRFGTCDKYLLDKLFYFIAACKRNGIYVALANYSPSDYIFAKDSDYAGYDKSGTHPYSLIYISSRYRKLYKKWARFLKKRNPYTHLKLCDDPTIIWFELQNNDSLFGANFDKIPKAQKRALAKKYDKWLLNRHGDRRSILHTWNIPQKYHPVVDADGLRTNNPRFVLLSPSTFTKPILQNPNTDFMNKRKKEQILFLMKLKRDVDEELTNYLRKNCKFKGIICPGGSLTLSPEILGPVENMLNSEGGLVARTAYYAPDIQGDQKSFLPGTSFKDRSALKNPLSSPIIFPDFPGKATIETIAGWPLPNKYRAEAVPLMAAYLSLHGTGAVLWFDNQSPDWVSRLRQNSVFCPAIAGSFPGYALMFRRGDVSKGAAVATLCFTKKSLSNLSGAPLDYSNKIGSMKKRDLKSPKGEINPSACLVGRVNYIFDKKRTSSTIHSKLIKKHVNKKKGLIKSSTGELTLNFI